MNDQNTASGLQGTRLPTIGNNGAVLLSKAYRDKLIAVVNALLNLEFVIWNLFGNWCLEFGI